jgi:hypothetical protein
MLSVVVRKVTARLEKVKELSVRARVCVAVSEIVYIGTPLSLHVLMQELLTCSRFFVCLLNGVTLAAQVVVCRVTNAGVHRFSKNAGATSTF